MRVSLILSLIREDLIRSLLWTLVHSLWQGLALAILAGLVILITRRSAPVWRYNIFLGLLCLFIAGAGTTFFLVMKSSPSSSAAVSGGGALFSAVNDVQISAAVTPVEEKISWGRRIIAFFNERANIIVAIWFIVLGIRLGKLLSDMWNVQHLRRYYTSEPDDYWKERVVELARTIGITKTVRMLESSIVKTPMMAGALKPVILVPLGLLAQLPPQEMEAILLHELAHIRRKDYLVNLLQCFTEILFFFNPAVLWISSLIREERENCCDDIAVGTMQNKREFVNALVSFQEYGYMDGALTFAGTKKHLLRRVKRIIHSDNKTLNVREKFFLLACLFVTAGLTLTYARQTPAPVQIVSKGANVEPIWQAPPVADVPLSDKQRPVKTAPPPIIDHPMKTVPDTSKKPAPVKDSVGKEDERKWEMMLQQQKRELEIQQQRLDEERDKLAERQRELEEEQARLNLQYLKASKDTLGPLSGDQGRLRLLEAQSRLNLINHMQREAMEKSELQLRDNRLRLEGIIRLQDQRLSELKKQLDASEGQIDGSQRRLFLSSGATKRLTNSMDQIIKPLLKMLFEKGLVKQLDELSFTLNNDEFILNVKKQPDDIFLEFKTAFIHSKKDYIKYSRHNGSESTSISQNEDK